MLDIVQELNESKNQFITVYDLIREIKEHSAENVEYSHVASWLIRKFCHNDTNTMPFLRVLNKYFLMEYAINDGGVDEDIWHFERHVSVIVDCNCLPIRQSETNFEDDEWFDDWFFETGFDRNELLTYIPELEQYFNIKEKENYPSIQRSSDNSAAYMDNELRDLLDGKLKQLHEGFLILKQRIENQTQDSDPFIIYGHTSEGLLFLVDAVKQFWSTYDEGDKNTAPKSKDIINYLKGKGVSSRMAEAIDLIIRPNNMRNLGRR